MTQTTYPKRLIEVDLPIKRISAHARREKSIRHGHISTLHIWWARRPLAACRAVICAALWFDPADENCPPSFRKSAREQMRKWARDSRGMMSAESYDHFEAVQKNPALLDDEMLRSLLLDFIADFANWDNSSRREYLETSRALTEAAHLAAGGVSGTRPLVVDPFTGGGAIPLEALRVGADAFASDLNPVAVLLNKVVLEYIPRYGQQLADEVRKWGGRVKAEAEKELAEFYPNDPDGATPIAYLWGRTIKCEGPNCGVVIPLIRNTQITRKGRKWYLNIVDSGTDRIEIFVDEGGSSKSKPTVSGGSVTCPRKSCGYTTPEKLVKAQLAQQHGGANNARLLAVYLDSTKGRYFRNPIKSDIASVDKAKQTLNPSLLPQDEINPLRPYKNTRGLSAVTRIGLQNFGDLYTARQALAIHHLYEIVLRIDNKEWSPNLRVAVLTTLNCVVSRFVFQNCSLSRWNAARSTIEGAFGKQALQVVWDFAESNPISAGPANWDGAIDWVVKVIEANSCLDHPASISQAPAQSQLLPNDSAQALITDPPYFAAIPYSDLSNVFYVWERRFIKSNHPDLYVSGLVKQQDEIIVTNANSGQRGRQKTPEFFKEEMTRALEVSRHSVMPSGIGVIVFADSSTVSWESMLSAVIDAGWFITGSWPIDTELQNRTQAAQAASLQSSIHIVCRPRENPDGTLSETIGDWRDVLRELPVRIHEWMPRLAKEGVVGADAIFACLGPALEIFSRYSRVERASGEQVVLREYLEHVWAAVAKEALSMIFGGARDADVTGFEEDARLTAMWLWTLFAGVTTDVDESNAEAQEGSDGEDETSASGKSAKPSGFTLEYDAARKIAQGLGAHLEDLMQLIEVKGDKARLLPVAERTKHLFGKDEAEAPRRGKKKDKQAKLFDTLDDVEAEAGGWGDKTAPQLGDTVLDRVHQAMILFAAGRSDATKRFLVDDGVGNDERFWRLANALSALYPSGGDEKRWVDGVLARKKGLGF